MLKPSRQTLALLAMMIAAVSATPLIAEEPPTTQPTTQPANANQEDQPVPAALNFTLKDIDGKEVNLASKYKGKVVLMVNVASRCGLTKQYTALEALHQKYASKGLSIVGFPANNFGAQEPGTDEEIKTFCSTKYNVGFDMFSKISVKGEDKHPLYAYLTEQDPVGKQGGDIGWNFAKFLINRKGEVVARIEPKTEPNADEVVKAIEAELAK